MKKNKKDIIAEAIKNINDKNDIDQIVLFFIKLKKCKKTIKIKLFIF